MKFRQIKLIELNLKLIITQRQSLLTAYDIILKFSARCWRDHQKQTEYCCCGEEDTPKSEQENREAKPTVPQAKSREQRALNKKYDCDV